jgi:hypothetical protein
VNVNDVLCVGADHSMSTISGQVLDATVMAEIAKGLAVGAKLPT